jgi:hypothetical protein
MARLEYFPIYYGSHRRKDGEKCGCQGKPGIFFLFSYADYYTGLQYDTSTEIRTSSEAKTELFLQIHPTLMILDKFVE